MWYIAESHPRNCLIFKSFHNRFCFSHLLIFSCQLYTDWTRFQVQLFSWPNYQWFGLIKNSENQRLLSYRSGFKLHSQVTVQLFIYWNLNPQSFNKHLQEQILDHPYLNKQLTQVYVFIQYGYPIRTWCHWSFLHE